MSEILFKDRTEAGKELARVLRSRAFSDPVVLALPRGGVTVAAEVARLLKAELDVVIARKIGAPGHPEYGIGAISEDEVPHFNPGILKYFDVEGAEVRDTVQEETDELRRRIRDYRRGRALPELVGKSVIVVDDGLATGVTAAAAGAYLRTLEPRELIFAAPVCPEDIAQDVIERFDEIICLGRPRNFQAVGLWYEDFRQVEDAEVMRVLERFHPGTQSQGDDHAKA